MEKEKVQKGECLAFYFISITKKCSHSGLGEQGLHTKKGNAIFSVFQTAFGSQENEDYIYHTLCLLLVKLCKI